MEAVDTHSHIDTHAGTHAHMYISRYVLTHTDAHIIVPISGRALTIE